MDRPATTSPATARDIIHEILRNMREGLEPLHYSTLPPSIYDVYLHPDDMDRLRGILPRIVDEARRALDAELEAMNRGSVADRLKGKFSKQTEPKITVPEGGWQIRLHENTDEDVEQGDIVIHSELALPPKPEYGAGSMTKRIATRKNTAGGTATYKAAAAEPAPAAAPQTAAVAAQPASEPAAAEPAALPEGCLAVLEYEDQSGKKTYYMSKDQIVVGRGGRDYWTDLKLDTVADVSREHFRLRRDPESGKFFLKDLSRLGTTINGEKAPSSIDFTGGEKRDKNVEAPVPDQARIGLADVLVLEFRSASHG